MPLITASVLTTLGLSVITGAIKCLKEGSLGKASLEGLDGLFGGILGNVCHEGYNHVRLRLESATKSPTIKQNADVERCSRAALLEALISFCEAAKQQLDQTNLSAPEQAECLTFLKDSQKHFAKKLAGLAKLPDTDPALNRNPLAHSEALTRVLATDQEQARIAAMKLELTDFALTEFTYLPGHLLRDLLTNWLPQGLPDGRHWFVYYVHAFHANLKQDEPAYCKNARTILTQKQLADIHLLSRANLKRLDELMTLTTEIRDAVAAIQVQLDRMEENQAEQTGLLQEIRQHQKLHTVDKPDPTVFPKYAEYQRLLDAKNTDFAQANAEQLPLRQKLAIRQDQLRAADANNQELLLENIAGLEQKIADLEQQRLTIDQERQQIQKDLADFARATIDFAKTLSASPDRDSPLLREARERFEAGDFDGANAVLQESRIEAMIAQADAQQTEANAGYSQAAQAYLAKAKAIAGARPENWLNEAIRCCNRAVDTWVDYDIVFEAACFLQTYNQFAEAIALYNRAFQFELTGDQKASIANNLAVLLAEYPEEHGQARTYYQEALTLCRTLAENNPAVYTPDLATALNNLAILLAEYPEEHGQARAYYQETLTLRQTLADNNPAVYTPYLARTLNNLANLLGEYPEEHGQARRYYQQALDLHRTLAENNPAVYTPDLATALNNLATLLGEYPEEHGQARRYYQQALDLRQTLAENNPAVYTSPLAQTLNNLAGLLAGYPEERGQARTYIEEALILFRALAENNPAVYTPDLAQALNNLAGLLTEYPEEHGQGRAYYQEALTLYRTLADNNPGVYTLALARTLTGLSNFLTYQQPERDTALSLVREAYPLLQPLRDVIPLAKRLAGQCEMIAEHWGEAL